MQRLYTVELPGLAIEDGWTVVRKEGYTLYLQAFNSEDAPGITIFAEVENLKPSWDWSEFQEWSSETRKSVFGAYFDKKYPSIDVSYRGPCRFQVERFDHRVAAEEIAYGKWLRNIEPKRDSLYDFPKGLLVSVPIHQCEALPAQQQSTTQFLSVSVADVKLESESIEIGFRIRQVGTWLRVWGRLFDIS